MLGMILNIGDVGHAIQLALAPVFLLAGIAGILNVMAGRLARIFDRGRQLTERAVPPHLRSDEKLQHEFRGLERRRHLASAAITGYHVLGAAGPLAVAYYCDVVGNDDGAFAALGPMSVLGGAMILARRAGFNRSPPNRTQSNLDMNPCQTLNCLQT